MCLNLASIWLQIFKKVLTFLRLTKFLQLLACLDSHKHLLLNCLKFRVLLSLYQKKG